MNAYCISNRSRCRRQDVFTLRQDQWTPMHQRTDLAQPSAVISHSGGRGHCLPGTIMEASRFIRRLAPVYYVFNPPSSQTSPNSQTPSPLFKNGPDWERLWLGAIDSTPETCTVGLRCSRKSSLETMLPSGVPSLEPDSSHSVPILRAIVRFVVFCLRWLVGEVHDEHRRRYKANYRL